MQFARRRAVNVKWIPDSCELKLQKSVVAEQVQEQDTDQTEGVSLKRFVTFYFTNFPPHLSNFYLRKGFEVCGMLEDVIVPSKRNVSGDSYGFVRFANVCNMSKLLKAVNDVYFGNFRVRAKVARFDRSDAKVMVREGVDAREKAVAEGKKGQCDGELSGG